MRNPISLRDRIWHGTTTRAFQRSPRIAEWQATRNEHTRGQQRRTPDALATVNAHAATGLQLRHQFVHYTTNFRE
jgi:hypothetical protein